MTANFEKCCHRIFIIFAHEWCGGPANRIISYHHYISYHHEQRLQCGWCSRIMSSAPRWEPLFDQCSGRMQKSSWKRGPCSAICITDRPLSSSSSSLETSSRRLWMLLRRCFQVWINILRREKQPNNADGPQYSGKCLPKPAAALLDPQNHGRDYYCMESTPKRASLSKYKLGWPLIT